MRKQKYQINLLITVLRTTMYSQWKKWSVVCVAITICLAACKKDDTEKNTEDLLIGTWQMIGWSGYCPTGNKTSSPASYNDNTLTFNADGTFVIDYGVKRGSGEPANGNRTGNWAIFEQDGKNYWKQPPVISI